MSIRERFSSSIGSLLNKKVNFQTIIFSFEEALRHTETTPAVISVLQRTIEQVFSPSNLHIFAYDPEVHSYLAAQGHDGRPTSDLRFKADNPLVAFLRMTDDFTDLQNVSNLPSDLVGELPHLRILGPGLIFPINSSHRLAGWLIANPQTSVQIFNSSEIQQITFLCRLSAMVMNRIEDRHLAEKHAQEVNTLVEISKSVNITVGFDDVLELIFTSVNQIIPTSDFKILFYDPKKSAARFIFFLQNDQRNRESENHYYPLDDRLEGEIIRTQSPILIDDFEQAYRQRGWVPTESDFFAWMGVPLNVGSDTIGAITVASRNAAKVYSADQLNWLQAIADQVAGAIVKTQLLQETGQRAHQLALLNDAARKFSSFFELQPLMQSILQYAGELFHCRSGYLALEDIQSGKMLARAVFGSIPAEMISKPLSSKDRWVEQAIQTRQPVIPNLVLETPLPRSDSDSDTNNQSQLVFPLVINEKTIGLIKLSDCEHNLPLDADDSSLIAIFANQVTTALEMTRSYIKTDQALADRVEELSVMQQIDRELNTSLDITKAMQITLDWAMHQSQAGAGLIGLVEPEGVQVMSSQGYSSELTPFLNAHIPPEVLAVDTILQNSLPAYLYNLNADTERPGLLINCRSQAIIPIRRETNVIGLILLESILPEFWSPDSLAFLSRLSDHASVAIFNAQLYRVVQDANNAKSEFVSFVAHELKNPMTSIKGYTELLAAGAVGPVSAPQANFLTTIRSNIDRMNTLISDLNDISKIEAGRLRLEFKAFSLSDTVEEAVRSARRQIEEKKQSLTIQIPPDLPPVWADRTRLIQILVNLMSNANKYTPHEGQIKINAEVGASHTNKPGAVDSIHLWVQDNGIGISDEDQKRIFQKFFRSEDPKTRETTGIGLGLSITRSLVEMQGGHIWFESKFRQGTTFHISLPISDQIAN